MNTRHPDLIHTILDILQQHPSGISEVKLLKALSHQGFEHFSADRSQGQYDLFRRHFLLFHLIYQCQNYCYQHQIGNLKIHTLSICLQPYSPGQASTQAYDKLKEYYLDDTQLDTTTQADVEAMLDNFWQGIQPLTGTDEALATLEMQDASDFQQVKRQYRKLAMRDHPDRGGSTDKLQRLNQAKETMRQYFAHPLSA